MKMQFFLVLWCLSIAFTSCEEDKRAADQGQNLGNLHISKENPRPGDELELTYNASSTGEDNPEVEAYYRFFVGPKAYMEDIDFVDSSGVWKAQIKVPDSAQAIAFNISKDSRLDNNNKKGFVLQLYDEDGKVLPGSRASQAFYYQVYGSSSQIENDSILPFLKKDLLENPSLAEEWDVAYAKILYSTDKEKGEQYINRRIKDRGGDTADQKDLTAIYSFYEVMKNKESADSLQQVIIKKYPKSDFAKRKYLGDVRSASDLAMREKIFEEFHNKFGAAEKGVEKNSMLNILASAYAENGNWEKFDRYASLMNDKGMKANLFNNTAWQIAQKGKNLEKAAELSAASLELVDEGKKPDYWTRKQFENNKKYTERMYYDTYAYILMKQDKLEEAIKYQEKAVADGSNSEYNERYIALLLQDDQVERAREKAAEFIKINAATTTVKEDYKKAYVKSTGSETGYKEKLAELENAGREKAVADLKKEMVNEEAPAFTLRDLDGKEVSLASLEGKTVIVDFWATWCVPCISSFPGMKVAVEKYKNDPNVEFLFVDTWENKPTLKKDVQKFIADNGYPFHVLFDEPVKDTSKFTTTEAYDISGIPTKIIIGPDGKMKFKMVGYGGNNDVLVQEIEIMIELVKEQEKNTKPVA